MFSGLTAAWRPGFRIRVLEREVMLLQEQVAKLNAELEALSRSSFPSQLETSPTSLENPSGRAPGEPLSMDAAVRASDLIAIENRLRVLLSRVDGGRA
jgi:hypothetical protein